MMYLLIRHPLNKAKIIFNTLWKKKDLIVKDYYGKVVNADEDMNINIYIFSLFKFEYIDKEYIIDIDEWMLNNFYNAACRFCKINSRVFYEEDPYLNVNKDFDKLIREDRNELTFNDFKDFIPTDNEDEDSDSDYYEHIEENIDDDINDDDTNDDTNDDIDADNYLDYYDDDEEDDNYEYDEEDENDKDDGDDDGDDKDEEEQY